MTHTYTMVYEDFTAGTWQEAIAAFEAVLPERQENGYRLAMFTWAEEDAPSAVGGRLREQKPKTLRAWFR